MRPRLALLTILAVALLGYAAAAGIMNDAFMGPAAPAVLGICFLTAIAIACLFMGWAPTARWLAKWMTGFGLVGTVVGLIIAMQGAKHTADPVAIMQNAFEGMGLALYSTAAGLIAAIWLSLNLALVGEE